MSVAEQARRARQSAASHRQNEEHRQQQPRKQKRYLRKRDLCERYNWKTPLSVDRNWKIYGTIPPPSLFRGRFPLWLESVLDEWDAAHQFESEA